MTRKITLKVARAAAKYPMDTVCATCGATWGNHIGMSCEPLNGKERYFVPAKSKRRGRKP